MTDRGFALFKEEERQKQLRERARRIIAETRQSMGGRTEIITISGPSIESTEISPTGQVNATKHATEEKFIGYGKISLRLSWIVSWIIK